jgi:hypothetical protein
MAGPWEKYAPQTKPPSTTLPYAGPQAQATLTRTQQEIKQAEATAGANTVKTRNEAVKSGIDVKAAQADLNIKTGTPPGDISKSGEAYLATLPPGVDDLTREMLAGKYKGSITSSRNPVVMQAALAAAHATKGNFDAGMYDERLALIKSITNPNSQLGALNTALAHAGHLYNQTPEVAGTDFFGHTPLSMGANAVANWWNSGSPEVTAYQSTLQKYAPESARAYGVATGAERQDAQVPLSINLPLDAKQASLKNDMELFAGKVSSLAHQYSMLGGNSPLDYFSPEAKAALQQIDPETYKKVIGITGGAVGPNTPPSGPTPPPTGSASGGPTNGPNNDRPDPQSQAFWEGAVRSGTPYSDALKHWQSDVKSRGLTTVAPPAPDQYNKAKTYIRNNPNVEYHPFQSVTREQMSGTDQMLNSAAQSAPGAFAAHYYNPLLLGIPERLAGKEQSDYFNAVSNQQHPNASMAGDLMGTVGGAYLASKGVNAATDRLAANPIIARYLEGAGLLPKSGLVGEEARLAATKAAARQNLTGDAIYGEITGANQNPDHPVAGAATGGAAILAGNAAGRYLAGPAIAAIGDSKAGQAVANAVLKRTGGGSFSPPTPLTQGQDIVANQAGNAVGDISNTFQDATRLNLPVSFADAHPTLRTLLGSAVRKSPDVRTLAEAVLQPRQMGQAERAIGQINTNLAPVGDVPTLQANLLKQAQSKSAPLYDAAKSQPVPELTANPALKEVLDRPASQSAVRKGYETALNNGEDVGTLTYATDPNGNTVAYGNPSWNVLHYARQELDKSGETAVRRALDKQISVLNPGFKTADTKYAGIVKGSDALQAGADATGSRLLQRPRKGRFRASRTTSPSSSRDMPLTLLTWLSVPGSQETPYDAVNGSLGQQSKLGMVFPQGAPNFMRAQGLEGDMAKTAQEALGGSPTAARQQSDALFDSPMAGAATDIGAHVLSGGATAPLSLARLALKLSDARMLGIKGAKEKADAIGPLLLNTDPQANLLTLGQLLAQQQARKAYVNQARNLGWAGWSAAHFRFDVPLAFTKRQVPRTNPAKNNANIPFT